MKMEIWAKKVYESRGVTGGGGGEVGAGCSVPLMFLKGKFLLTYWENRGEEKRGNGEEKKENCEREGGKL